MDGGLTGLLVMLDAEMQGKIDAPSPDELVKREKVRWLWSLGCGEDGEIGADGKLRSGESWLLAAY